MKAIILAAGTGTRVLPLTLHRPKPLFPIYTIPLLNLTITQLREAGASDIIINTHHLNQKINSHLQKNSPTEVALTLSHEPHLLDTAGAIKNVEGFWDDQPFIVINGDIVSTIDINAAYQNHLKSGNLATLVLHHYPRYNNVEVDLKGTIVGIRDTRVKEPSSPTFKRAFTGIHIISPALLRDIPPNQNVDIIPVYLQAIARGMKVRGYQVENHYWRDIGTPEDYHLIHCDIHQNKLELNTGSHLLSSRADSSSIGEGTTLDGYTCIGRNTTVGENCTVRNSIIWDEVEIKGNLTIEGCIIGDGVQVTQSLKDKVVVTD